MVDVWVGDQEKDMDDSGQSDSDEMDGDRTLPGDDAVQGEYSATSGDQHASLQAAELNSQDQEWENEESESVAPMPVGTPPRA